MEEQTTHTNESNTPQTEPVATTSQKVTEKPVNKTAVAVGLLVLALLAAALYWGLTSTGTVDLGGTDGVAINEDATGIVATVNGEEVTRAEFNQSVAQVETTAEQQGADVTNPEVQAEIESQALQSIVNTKLLIQAASEAGVEATESEIDAQLTALEEQFGGAEALQEQAASLNLSQEQLRADIKEQLEVDAFIRQSEEYAEVAVTEEEVNEFYATLTAQGQELPPLEEVAGQIETQLLAQEQQAAVGAIIERLRGDADIKVMI